MQNILPNIPCKLVNIVWIERGILLTIIYNILIKYNILLNKIIIIDIYTYRNFLKKIFPNLTFKKFIKHNKANFYFNIRNIIKKQDIIIDYLANYDYFIQTKKISLLPWFDMNDIIISYEYDLNEKKNVNQTKHFIIDFCKCRRGNYNNKLWDSYIENYVFNKYYLFNKQININIIINIFNNFIKSNYTNTVIEYPKIYYIEKNNNLIPQITTKQKSNIISNLNIQTPIKQELTNIKYNNLDINDIKKVDINKKCALNELLELINNNIEVINKTI
jgi:hypothetical protein